jgi:hypothetical protein
MLDELRNAKAYSRRTAEVKPIMLGLVAVNELYLDGRCAKPDLAWSGGRGGPEKFRGAEWSQDHVRGLKD